ncbi:MAG TPA: hypothetical protein VFF30_10330 [Nitrososphaerales archaeon]|nr:hypothetical protein [Nitrososphaerales archaeon]
MGIYLVQHEWEANRSNEVKSIVSQIIENDRAGKLPAGYGLLGVMLSKDEPRAYCVWEAESKSGLEGLLKSVNPPTRNSVQPFDVLYGVSKESLA